MPKNAPKVNIDVSTYINDKWPLVIKFINILVIFPLLPVNVFLNEKQKPQSFSSSSVTFKIEFELCQKCMSKFLLDACL